MKPKNTTGNILYDSSGNNIYVDTGSGLTFNGTTVNSSITIIDALDQLSAHDNYEGTKNGTELVVGGSKAVIWDGMIYYENEPEYIKYTTPLGKKLEGIE